MFRAFGHQNSSILDGGLPEWESFKNAIETETDPEYQPEKSVYPTPTLDGSVIRSNDVMLRFPVIFRRLNTMLPQAMNK
jgi:thiosulfate/3-mercaptopyruvate sulfurtransferase